MEDQLLRISSLYAMTNPLPWSQTISVDENYRFKPILILVQVELPKNESNAYQELTFSSAANNMFNFQTKMKSDILEIRTLMHQNPDFMHKHVFNK